MRIGPTMKEITFHYFRGRVALHATLKALNVGESDEIILQAFTCLAVASPIVGISARPVYLDIDPKTFNFDLNQLESKISKIRRPL